jgi:hypothetical protein
MATAQNGYHRRDLPQSYIVGRCDCVGIWCYGFVGWECVVTYIQNGQQILDENNLHIADCANVEIAKMIVYQVNVHDSLVQTLIACRDQFEFYKEEHNKAGKTTKELTNAAFEEICALAVELAKVQS